MKYTIEKPETASPEVGLFLNSDADDDGMIWLCARNLKTGEVNYIMCFHPTGRISKCSGVATWTGFNLDVMGQVKVDE